MKSRLSMGLVVLVLAAALLATAAWAQGSPRVTGVEPATVKVGANITVKGENLTKDNVAGVFVSNSSDDFPATIVEQGGSKIIVKIPKVKAGDYNISIQVKADILIQPIRLTVQE
jgi:spermidine/putrescine-binding protein